MPSDVDDELSEEEIKPSEEECTPSDVKCEIYDET